MPIYRYEIEPRTAELGGGMDDAYADALNEAESWLAARGDGDA